jgi:hypothetical protein
MKIRVPLRLSIALVKLFQNVIIGRCLVPLDAFSAYRLVAVFLVTLAIACAFYRCQVMKKNAIEIIKRTPTSQSFIAGRAATRDVVRE